MRFPFFTLSLLVSVLLVLGFLGLAYDRLNREEAAADLLTRVKETISRTRLEFASDRDYSGLGGGYFRDGNHWGTFFVGAGDRDVFERAGFYIRLTRLPYYACLHLYETLPKVRFKIIEDNDDIILWHLGGSLTCVGADGKSLNGVELFFPRGVLE